MIQNPDSKPAGALTRIIHEHFCCNRRCRTQARRARLAGKARQAKKFWVLSSEVEEDKKGETSGKGEGLRSEVRGCRNFELGTSNFGPRLSRS